VHRRPRFVVPVEELHGSLEQVLEVEQPVLGLPLLVLAEHAAHQVGRHGRLVLPEPVVVRVGREPPVLRPLDFRREVAGGPEAVGAGQRVADPAQEHRLRGEDPARISLEAAEQCECRRVEGRRAHALDAERTQPRAQLARRLLGECHRQDVLRRECAARDLPGDATRDRRRLARAGPGQDAQWSARALHGGALLRVQAVEDLLGVQVAEANDGIGRAPSRKGQRFVSTRGSISST
jgi:hypothetical protein